MINNWIQIMSKAENKVINRSKSFISSQAWVKVSDQIKPIGVDEYLSKIIIPIEIELEQM